MSQYYMLQQVQSRADLLGWSVETHRKGYFIRYGEVPGYPEHPHGYIVASLDEAASEIESAITLHERNCIALKPLMTQGKLQSPASTDYPLGVALLYCFLFIGPAAVVMLLVWFFVTQNAIVSIVVFVAVLLLDLYLVGRFYVKSSVTVKK